VKRKLLAVGVFMTMALAALAPEASAQVPTPKPVAPTPRPTGAPAPRAGGFPMELAFPLLAGGGAAIGSGVYLLRRRRKE
jgi:LPXTG-motif cell wall-anchored protein